MNFNSYLIYLMDRKSYACEIGLGLKNRPYRGGDPERFRDEAKGLGRVALLGHFLRHQT
jgi:hypothetical protein